MIVEPAGVAVTCKRCRKTLGMDPTPPAFTVGDRVTRKADLASGTVGRVTAAGVYVRMDHGADAWGKPATWELRPAAPAAGRCVARYTYALQCALENMRDAAAYDAAHGVRPMGAVSRAYRYTLDPDGFPTPATIERADPMARSYIAGGTTSHCPAHGSVGTDH